VQVAVQRHSRTARRSVQERFGLYVYPVPRALLARNGLRSAIEIEARLQSTRSGNWIVIPQGHSEDPPPGRAGHHAERDPPEPDGQNVLYIRNDDIADHTVGPFFIRAGKRFARIHRAADFVGKCTILPERGEQCR